MYTRYDLEIKKCLRSEDRFRVWKSQCWKLHHVLSLRPKAAMASSPVTKTPPVVTDFEREENFKDRMEYPMGK